MKLNILQRIHNEGLNIDEISHEMQRINVAQEIGNYDQFGPLANDAVVIVVQVIISF